MNDYAILGWGSLLWDLDDLSPHVRGPWRVCAGPALPMEFTRISPKRKHGLVVCLDADHGVSCQTHAIASVRREIEGASEDLARRERAPREMIGSVCLRTGAAAGRSEAVVGAVSAWCSAQGWAGAVWTDLESNFTEFRGETFTIAGATGYLQSLSGDSLDEAVQYIENAPAETDTPLRRALAGETWWQAEARRLGVSRQAGTE